MAGITHSENPSAQVIHSLLRHRHELSVYSKHARYALPAEVTELDLTSGNLVLEAEYASADIGCYINDGYLSFDIEALKVPENEREIFTLSNVPVKVLKTDSTTYRLECQLPDSVFVKESRGGVRIPFILGMQARVSVEVYLHEFSIPGRLRNLSV